MGLGISIGRGVSMSAPFINFFFEKLNLNPLIAYGIGGVLCIPLLGILPETFGSKMPDHLEDEDNSSEKPEQGKTML